MEERTTIRSVLFDIDDTLFDRKSAVKEALRGIARELPDLFEGIPEEKVFTSFHEADENARVDFDRGEPGEIVRDRRSKSFLSALGLPETQSKTITDLYINSFPKISSPVRDAPRVVEVLSEEYSLGIISNAYPDVQYNKLKGIGLLEYFDVIILSEEIGIRKPEKAIFLKAAELLGNAPSECLFVGDSFDTDVVGSAESGMRSCWFNPEGEPITDVGIQPDYVISSLTELLSILQ
jgi:HAD superfamily hydrolase (TIGR01549 family)